MKELIKKAIPAATEEQCEKFLRYFGLLTEWNEKMNLTAITEPSGVAEKHFADSVLPLELIPHGARAIDVGTGAGFPGVPIMIMRSDVQMVLLDSLNKRLTFLEALLGELGLSARLFHMRAEDAGRSAEFRDRFDIALTRAVAPAPLALEWTAPLVTTGGSSLMYRGQKAKEELAECENAARLLRAQTRLQTYPAPWGERAVIIAKKTAPTPKAYPRKPGVKTPL